MEPHEKPPIGEVIEALTGYPVPTGRRVKVRCFWHDDTRASASVDHDKNLFKCFSCDKQGDSLSLIREEIDGSFEATIEWAEASTSWTRDGVPGATAWGTGGDGVPDGAARTGRAGDRRSRARLRRRRRST